MERPSRWIKSTVSTSGAGSKDVTFSSKDAAKPAEFYLFSYPAHAEIASAMVKFADLKPVELGTVETCNKRRIYKAIYKEEGIKSCQLVMGFTMLEPGSNWNTMPPHTHMRRSEVYFYFDAVPGASRVAPDGAAGCDESSGDGEQGSCSFAGMVDPCRRRTKHYTLAGVWAEKTRRMTTWMASPSRSFDR